MSPRRKALRSISVGFFSGLIAGKALSQTVKCPICNNTAYFTGETRLDVSGKFLRKYQCMMFSQHNFWMVA